MVPAPGTETAGKAPSNLLHLDDQNGMPSRATRASDSPRERGKRSAAADQALTCPECSGNSRRVRFGAAPSHRLRLALGPCTGGVRVARKSSARSGDPSRRRQASARHLPRGAAPIVRTSVKAMQAECHQRTGKQPLGPSGTRGHCAASGSAEAKLGSPRTTHDARTDLKKGHESPRNREHGHATGRGVLVTPSGVALLREAAPVGSGEILVPWHWEDRQKVVGRAPTVSLHPPALLTGRVSARCGHQGSTDAAPHGFGSGHPDASATE